MSRTDITLRLLNANHTRFLYQHTLNKLKLSINLLVLTTENKLVLFLLKSLN